MLDQPNCLPQRAREILGDLSALAAALGSPAGLADMSLGAVLPSGAPARNAATLKQFLAEYLAQVCLPCELPAVARAHRHTTRGELRELIALDWGLKNEVPLAPFARASCHVGSVQLRRLKPLRSERIVQRYLRAVEAKEAGGWHSLVFGMVLALYSLPLRQGLVHFAYQTLGGYVDGAADQLGLNASARAEILADCTPALTAGVEEVVLRQYPIALEAPGLISG